MKYFISRALWAVSLTALAVSLYLYAKDFRPIIYKVAEKSVAQVIESSQVNKADFKLLFCGTGSPNRTTDRGQPCTALVADGKLFLFDAGEGSLGKLTEYGAPLGSLHSIFLTHLHSDHISGVAEVLHNTWLYGRMSPAEIIGPPGTNEVIQGFEAAYLQDLDERTHTLGADAADKSLAFSGARDVLVEGESADVVYQANGLTIRVFLVDHPTWPQAYGYRIEHKGKVVVISGDTRASDGIRKHAKNADILIHEAINSEIFGYVGDQMVEQGGAMSKGRMDIIESVHTPTLELATIAQNAGVRKLIITHLIPAMPAVWFVDQFFTAGMDDIYTGELTIARDGQWVEVSE